MVARVGSLGTRFALADGVVMIGMLRRSEVLVGTCRIASLCFSRAFFLKHVFSLYYGGKSEGTEQREQAEDGDGR